MPSANGANGSAAGAVELAVALKGANGLARTADGRFAAGNGGGPGNPHASRVAELRGALLDAVTPDDVADIVRSMIEAAKCGDVAAAKLILDRLMGREPILAVVTPALDDRTIRVVHDPNWYGNEAQLRAASLATLTDEPDGG